MVTIPGWFVILMGMGTVFAGLLSIILLCKLLSAVCSIEQKVDQKRTAEPAPAPCTPQNTTTTKNRQELIAAIGAVIAEECGVDANGIRIVSIKRI